MSVGGEWLCQSFPELLQLEQPGEQYPLSVFTKLKNKKDVSRHLVADRFLSFKKTGVRMIEERLVNFCQLDTRQSHLGRRNLDRENISIRLVLCPLGWYHPLGRWS